MPSEAVIRGTSVSTALPPAAFAWTDTLYCPSVYEAPLGGLNSAPPDPPMAGAARSARMFPVPPLPGVVCGALAAKEASVTTQA